MENRDTEEKTLVKMEEISLKEMNLEEKRRAEQLYGQLGMEPVVDRVLSEFSNSLTGLDRVVDRVFGPYDIRGRANAVARVTALVTYAALSEQYNKESANLESQIISLQEERSQVKTSYDNLVEKVADVVGGDHEELKANYDELVNKLAEVEHLKAQVATLNNERAQLVERVAKTLGEDYEELKGSYSKLVERLAELERLREALEIANKEKAQLRESCEAQIAELESEHSKAITDLRAQIDERDSKIEGLEAEKTSLTKELEKLRAGHQALTRDYNELKTAITKLEKTVPYEEIKSNLGEELYDFLLKDSKVPDIVIDGVSRFIDFRKYLGISVGRGAEEACKRIKEILSK